MDEIEKDVAATLEDRLAAISGHLDEIATAVSYLAEVLENTNVRLEKNTSSICETLQGCLDRLGSDMDYAMRRAARIE